MKRVASVVAGVMTAALMVGSGFAADNGRDSAATDKPGRLAMPHSVTGSIVDVNESARTFTVRDSNGKDFVLTTDPSSGSPLSDIKAGGYVKVSYKKAPSGQLVAMKITQAHSTRTD
jgi:hypothetical protein